MNEKQTQLYWRLWSRCARRLAEQGKDRAEIECIRKRIHWRVNAYWFKGGKLLVKSSKHLNNRDFDQVKAVFLSICESSNLQAQLDQLEMPAKRIRHAAAELLDTLEIEPHGRDAYLAGVARKPLEDCDDEDLQRILIALTHSAKHKLRIDHNHPRTGKGPVAKYGHHVGARSATPIVDPRTAKRDTRDAQTIQTHLGI